jgi:hypothetical protein
VVLSHLRRGRGRQEEEEEEVVLSPLVKAPVSLLFGGGIACVYPFWVDYRREGGCFCYLCSCDATSLRFPPRQFFCIAGELWMNAKDTLGDIGFEIQAHGR